MLPPSGSFCRHELLPPFRQLECNSYALTEVERNASELHAGQKCLSGRVMGLANKGWMCEPQDGGWIGWMIKPLGRWSLIMEIDEGLRSACRQPNSVPSNS